MFSEPTQKCWLRMRTLVNFDDSFFNSYEKESIFIHTIEGNKFAPIIPHLEYKCVKRGDLVDYVTNGFNCPDLQLLFCMLCVPSDYNYKLTTLKQIYTACKLSVTNRKTVCKSGYFQLLDEYFYYINNVFILKLLKLATLFLNQNTLNHYGESLNMKKLYNLITASNSINVKYYLLNCISLKAISECVISERKTLIKTVDFILHFNNLHHDIIPQLSLLFELFVKNNIISSTYLNEYLFQIQIQNNTVLHLEWLRFIYNSNLLSIEQLIMLTTVIRNWKEKCFKEKLILIDLIRKLILFHHEDLDEHILFELFCLDDVDNFDDISEEYNTDDYINLVEEIGFLQKP